MLNTIKIHLTAQFQCKKGCKDQKSIQSSTTPDTGYQWESNKFTVSLIFLQNQKMPGVCIRSNFCLNVVVHVLHLFYMLHDYFQKKKHSLTFDPTQGVKYVRANYYIVCYSILRYLYNDMQHGHNSEKKCFWHRPNS